MNKDIFKGKWQEFKGKIKQQWGEISDDELSKLKGNIEELSGLIQKKYGYTKDRVLKEINDFIERNK
jgi:uncharacterized protein YjbJ (UPF0337 family)